MREFAAQHEHEIFYGFFLDCNATYFEILGHLNTDVMLHAKAQASKLEHTELYKGVMIETLIEDFRWSGGDWGYFQIFDACGHDETYDRMIEDMIKHFTLTRRGIDSRIYEDFLDMACRVAARLERGNAFDGLQRTPNFRVLCADHDESVEDGERRLQRNRGVSPRRPGATADPPRE